MIFISNKTLFLKKPVFVNNTEHPEVMSVKFLLSNDSKSKYFLRDEFLQYLSMLRLMGVKLCVLQSSDIYVLQEQLVKMLPDIRQQLPVRVNLDYKSTSLVFLKNIKSLVNGFCLDLKIPLKQCYTEEEKIRFSSIYSMDTDIPIYQYRDNILNVINLIDDMKLTIYRTDTSKNLTDDDIEYMLQFAKELQGDYFLHGGND